MPKQNWLEYNKEFNEYCKQKFKRGPTPMMVELFKMGLISQKEINSVIKTKDKDG